MTRKEVSMQIGAREWRTGEILKTSGAIFLENITGWLLFSLIVFFPCGVLLQYVSMQLPYDLTAVLSSLESVEQLAGIDFSPYIVLYVLQIGLQVVFVLANVGAAVYTNRWMTADCEPYGTGECLRLSLQKWPRAILIAVLYILGTVGGSFFLFFGGIIMGAGLLLIGMFVLFGLFMMLFYHTVAAVSIRKEKGIRAFRYTFNVLRRKMWSSMWFVLLLVIINLVFTSILTRLTDSFFVLSTNVPVYCVVSGLLNALGNLPTFFLGIAVTIHFVNQEQMWLILAKQPPTPSTRPVPKPVSSIPKEGSSFTSRPADTNASANDLPHTTEPETSGSTMSNPMDVSDKKDEPFNPMDVH